MRYLFFGLIFLFPVFLASCASNDAGIKKESQLERYLVGFSQEELVAYLGAPTQDQTLSNGKQVWTYRDDAEGLTGGECTLTLIFNNGITENVTVLSRDWSPLSFPMGGCQNIIGRIPRK
ncbi:MAG: hypothetical protein IH901_01840 [Proteobacteria bacterium]|nr:hypothetical protein [Pseudomonadota bacterium]